MPADPLSTPFESSSDLHGWRRLSGAITRLGVPLCTVVLAGLVSLTSLGLTALFLEMRGEILGTDTFWMALLAPLPVAVVFAGPLFMLVIALERSRLQL